MKEIKYLLISLIALLFSIDGKAITLKESIVKSLAHSYKMKVLDYDVKNSELKSEESITSWLPVINFRIERGLYKTSHVTKPRDLGTIKSNNSYLPMNMSLSIKENLFNGFQDTNSNLINDEKAIIQKISYEYQKEQLIFNTVLAYIGLYKSQEEYKVSEHTEKVLKRHYEVAKIRYNTGVVTKADLSMAYSRWSLSKADKIASLSNWEKMKVYFKSYTDVDVNEDLGFPLLPNLDEDFTNGVKHVLSNNKLLKIREHEAKIAYYAYKASLDSFLPTVDLKYSIADIRNSGGNFNPVKGPSQRVINQEASLEFNWLLLGSGKRYYAYLSSNNSYSKAKNAILETRNDLIRDIQSGWSDYNKAKAMVEALKLVVSSQNDTLETVIQQKSSGTKTLTDVLDSERDLENAKLDLVNAKYSLVSSLYNLLNKLGKLNMDIIK